MRSVYLDAKGNHSNLDSNEEGAIELGIEHRTKHWSDDQSISIGDPEAATWSAEVRVTAHRDHADRSIVITGIG